jgi:pimeloyl-ACP methyl ester carboxylesterase
MNMSSYTHITAPTQFVEAGGIRFAYRKFGRNSGVPLILLGHFRSTMENWDPAVTDGLGKDRPIILFSNAGIGLTTGDTPNTVAEMSRDAILFIDALGLNQVDLLGFSLGGFIAQQITLDRPYLVRRLVLAGTGPEGGQDMQTYIPEVQKVATNAIPVVDDFLYLFFSPSRASQMAGRAFWERRHQRETDLEPASSMAVMLAQAEAIGAWGISNPAFPRLHEIKQPVLIANGHNDIVVPTINSYILFKHIVGSRLILYPDSGHGFLFQFAEEFVRDVNSFLAGSADNAPTAGLHQTATTRFVDVNGTDYAFRTFGNKSGLPLILLQHFTGTMDNWDPKVTDGLAEHFQVVLFDYKGIGASGGQAPDKIQDMSQDVISFIKALGFDKVNLLGFSMGGFVAQQMALDEPGLINKMILAGTGPKGGEGLANTAEALTATATMTPEEQKLYFFYKPTSTSRALGQESLARINERVASQDPNTIMPAIQAQLKAILGWSESDVNTFTRLKRIKQPVLIVNGSDDIICPTNNSYIMFKNLSYSKLCLYPDSAHGAIFQYPGLFLLDAISFIGIQ